MCAERKLVSVPEREFIFIRHGETAYNHEGRFQGHIDVPLNSTGLGQAELAADLLADQQISRVVSSPARRVLETVRPFRQAREVPLHIEDDLMEFFVGGFEGRSIASVRRDHGLREGESWLTIMPDDAECWSEFISRVSSAVARWTAKYSGETLLIASHGLVFGALAEALTGTRLSSQNARPHRFRPVGDGWDVSAVEG